MYFIINFPLQWVLSLGTISQILWPFDPEMFLIFMDKCIQIAVLNFLDWAEILGGNYGLIFLKSHYDILWKTHGQVVIAWPLKLIFSEDPTAFSIKSPGIEKGRREHQFDPILQLFLTKSSQTLINRSVAMAIMLSWWWCCKLLVRRESKLNS